MKNNGCFEHCTNCNSHPICCSYFDQINAPTINKEELERIKKITETEDFYNTLDENLFSLKLSDNNCIFYKDHKCNIYDKRPLDCRLYPFDIIKVNQKYYLILYLLNCINHEQFKKQNHNIDELIIDIIPWINKFTDEQNFTKMKGKKYEIIKEINL